ncbi:MAG: hypothetical protein ABIZ05_07015 [Pseudonocardiaceae bacterium]
MSQAFRGWVLDHHAIVSWARVEPYAQSLVWSAMEVGMAAAVPVAALPLAYAATRKSDHDVLRALLELPVTLHDPLTEADAPELGRILASATDPAALSSDVLALAYVVQSAHPRGWPVLTGSECHEQPHHPLSGYEREPVRPGRYPDREVRLIGTIVTGGMGQRCGHPRPGLL